MARITYIHINDCCFVKIYLYRKLDVIIYTPYTINIDFKIFKEGF